MAGIKSVMSLPYLRNEHGFKTTYGGSKEEREEEVIFPIDEPVDIVENVSFNEKEEEIMLIIAETTSDISSATSPCSLHQEKHMIENKLKGIEESYLNVPGINNDYSDAHDTEQNIVLHGFHENWPSSEMQHKLRNEEKNRQRQLMHSEANIFFCGICNSTFKELSHQKLPQ